MTLDRARLVASSSDDLKVRVRLNERTVVFDLDEEALRQVWWHISDSQLATLVAKLSPGAGAAQSRGGDGFSVLVTRLEEELLTFGGDRGEVIATNGRHLAIEER